VRPLYISDRPRESGTDDLAIRSGMKQGYYSTALQIADALLRSLFAAATREA